MNRRLLTTQSRNISFYSGRIVIAWVSSSAIIGPPTMILSSIF